MTSSAVAIYCYECNSSNNFSCTEFWDASDELNDQVSVTRLSDFWQQIVSQK